MVFKTGMITSCIRVRETSWTKVIADKCLIVAATIMDIIVGILITQTSTAIEKIGNE